MGTEKRKQRNSSNTTIIIRLSLSNWSFLSPLTDEVNVCNYYSNNLFHYLIQSKKNLKTHFLDYLLKSSFYGFALKPNFSAPLCFSSSSDCISFCLKKQVLCLEISSQPRFLSTHTRWAQNALWYKERMKQCFFLFVSIDQNLWKWFEIWIVWFSPESKRTAWQ